MSRVSLQNLILAGYVGLMILWSQLSKAANYKKNMDPSVLIKQIQVKGTHRV